MGTSRSGRVLAGLLAAFAVGACGGGTGPAGPDDTGGRRDDDAATGDDTPAPRDDGARDDAVRDGDARDDAAGVPDAGPDAADDGADAGDPGGDGGPLSYERAFRVPELLGRPTATSVTVNLVPAESLEARVAWGAAGGPLDHVSAALATNPGIPLLVTMEGLAPDARHDYQVAWRRPGDADFQAGPVRSFHTQRPPGATFTFAVQADPHLDEVSDLAMYQRTLDNEAADGADFLVDLGDTFMCEKHSQPFDAAVVPAPDPATVDARYLYERGNFGRVAHSLPLFLVNGNHEGEAGWFLQGAGDDLAVWTTEARLKYFLNPAPDGFYTGDGKDDPVVGKRAAWYAWHWGDALFVVLDPFWNTTTKGGKDAWVFTLGQAQYDWLVQTLSASPAAFKFVFIHNLVGGLDGQMRGGAEAAPFYEWGGKEEDGTDAFAAKRPGWAKPIHQVLVENGVTAVFHGHDHVYVKQDLDGIVYQETPQPSAPNFNSGPSLAAKYHYASGTIVGSSGHLRITVSPDRVRAEYVRAYRPQDENGTRKNGQVDDAWEVPAK